MSMRDRIARVSKALGIEPSLLCDDVPEVLSEREAVAMMEAASRLSLEWIQFTVDPPSGGVDDSWLVFVLRDDGGDELPESETFPLAVLAAIEAAIDAGALAPGGGE